MATGVTGAENKRRAVAQQQRREANHNSWKRRHPTLAAEERKLKRENRAARRDFGHKQNGTVETHQKAARAQPSCATFVNAPARSRASRSIWFAAPW